MAESPNPFTKIVVGARIIHERELAISIDEAGHRLNGIEESFVEEMNKSGMDADIEIITETDDGVARIKGAEVIFEDEKARTTAPVSIPLSLFMIIYDSVLNKYPDKTTETVTKKVDFNEYPSINKDHILANTSYFANPRGEFIGIKRPFMKVALVFTTIDGMRKQITNREVLNKYEISEIVPGISGINTQESELTGHEVMEIINAFEEDTALDYGGAYIGRL